MKTTARALDNHLSGWVCVLVAIAVALLAPRASAHDLEIDTLSVRVDTQSGRVEGQFLLDPEMTRPGGAHTQLAGSEQDREKERLLAFVRKHVHFDAGNGKVALSLQLRELYVKGGAVPGDSVIYQAMLPANWEKLSLEIDKPFEQLAVTPSLDGTEQPTILMSGVRPLVIQKPIIPTATTAGGAEKVTAENRAEPGAQRTLTLGEIAQYIWTGVIHIVPFGWDHILFVIALTLGSLGRSRRLLLELTAFTVAHTTTLGLGSLELIIVPASIVEPLIALSIAAVAAESLCRTESSRFRYALVACFGLLHGLGFAGALLGLGFSGGSFLVFLGSFNLGVEIGQLLVVTVSLALFWALARWPRAKKRIQMGLIWAIATCGLVVGIARIADNGIWLSGEPVAPSASAVGHETSSRVALE